ncbi:hypothetical protein HD806DRAFT_410257 [Xylariaceae sp. AK1471]|nr:hypothetical protein HD806DRAFT_410257 [Xylariaceae sp. AK1471]
MRVSPTSTRDVYFRLSTELLNYLKALDPTEVPTISRADDIVRRCLEVHVLPRHLPLARLRRSLWNVLQQASFNRQKRMIDFSGKHLKFLLRSALAHFAKQPTILFNIPQAVRVNNPIPANLPHHIADFLRCASLEGTAHASAMA